MRADLLDEGIPLGRRKGARLMRLARLKGCLKKRYRLTTQRDPAHPLARNLLEQQFVGRSVSAVQDRQLVLQAVLTAL